MNVVLSVTNDGGAHDRAEEAVESGDEQASSGEQISPAQERTPLPIRQLFVLCLMRFAEPISFAVVSHLSFIHSIQACAGFE